MKIVDQHHEILKITTDPIKHIEICGRTCYQSQPGSAEKFSKMILTRGHETVIEHAHISVRFVTNRGVTHELVRHRLCSFSQESTRYVRYDGNMEFIRPVWMNIPCGNVDEMSGKIYINGDWIKQPHHERFLRSLIESELAYLDLIDEMKSNLFPDNPYEAWRPEQAREVLPNSLKTEIVMSCNFREMRHILNLRCSKKAHPQIRALMLNLLSDLKEIVPVIFDDIYEKYIKKT